ncbi:hypothetical protein LCI18_011807 [Fusarium solani-melongenae]|uniref:Uncharacterized protein n=1 Tax=Fusarium solani subsp. cucurbitae TaxID=2747967 RepID=A0ACD3ZIU7_FUSSC|nr:hypothetical protein LCI18_011807 [Fusarium solani-melongenae]
MLPLESNWTGEADSLSHPPRQRSRGRKRFSQACVQCRSKKSRCVRRLGPDQPCLTCSMSGRDCSTSIAVTPLPAMPRPNPPLNSREIPCPSFQLSVHVYNVEPESMALLMHHGCFDVPDRATLEAFFQRFFLYIHPFMPLLNEAHFWDTFTSSSGIELVERGELPLVLLFSMLYTATGFLPLTFVESLGFKNIHDAKSTFYRRAELLYICNTEESSIVKAQAALLLSHSYFSQPPRSPSNLATMWLSRAIRHAELSGAQHYDTLQPPGHSTCPEQRTQPDTLKRLWWCCIIGDRVMPLASRRGMQIKGTRFDFKTKPRLGRADLSDEIDRPGVYDRDTKLVLVELLERLVAFCVLLTDILEMSYSNPVEGFAGLTSIESYEHFIQDYRRRLQGIRKAAMGRQPGYTHNVGSNDAPFRIAECSIGLFASLSILYTCTAETILGHYRMLITDFCFIEGNDSIVSTQRRTSCKKVEAATHETMECLEHLIHSRLVHLLPLSAVGCTVFTLLLQILNIRLRSISTQLGLNKDTELNDGNQMQQNFMLLIEAMQVYRLRHSAVDWILDAVRIIITRFCQSFPTIFISGLASSDHCPATCWSDILQYQPKVYLSLSMMLDLCVSNGRIPHDNDLPLYLRLMASPDLSSAAELFHCGIPESLNSDDFAILSATHSYPLRLQSHRRINKKEAGN